MACGCGGDGDRRAPVTVTVVFALLAAFSNAVHLMTQHAASTDIPDRHKGFALVGYLWARALYNRDPVQ